MKLFECVPNVSEGRDASVIAGCARAIRGAKAELAHQTSDPVHNRSVFTFFGTRDSVLAAAVALARVASFGIDLRTHAGAHPRIGALDVLPFVPLADATMDDAVALAREAAERDLARARASLATSTAKRRSGHSTVRSPTCVAANSKGWRHAPTAPTSATSPLHPSAGAIAVGARRVLIAFNIVLDADVVLLAKRIARTLRERNGGLRTVAGARHRARRRPRASLVQHDGRRGDAARPHRRSRSRAWPARRGVAVAGCELIGLVPRAALEAVAARAFAAPAS